MPGHPAAAAYASNGGLRHLPARTEAADEGVLAGKVPHFPRGVKRGQALFNAGDRLAALYTVRSGSFKTCMVDRAGREQVVGFSMAPDAIGLDGLSSGRHDLAAIALEDSEVCVLPSAILESAARHDPSLQRELSAALAREIARNHRVMMLLGSMSAEERLAAFLIDQSKRLASRGYSPRDFRLRMTRKDIGSYVGLTLPTVSRLFSTFARNGLIVVDKAHVRVLDMVRLQRVLK